MNRIIRYRRYGKKWSGDDEALFEHSEGELIKWADLQRHLDSTIDGIAYLLPNVDREYRKILEYQLSALTSFKHSMEPEDD